MTRARTLAPTLLLAVLAGVPQAAAQDGPTPLTLERVVDSARRHFPLFQAFRLEVEARDQALRSARGAFDLRAKLEGDVRPEGFYENYAGGATLEQPTPFWGSRFFGGYRIGDGDFASYDGGRLTDSQGELSVGVEVPLLRGGLIDDPRAKIRRSEIDVERLDPETQLESIGLVRDATFAYFAWLAAGRDIEIAEGLLEVADARQSQLTRRVERGNEPAIDLVDNRRLVVERQALLRGAERDFEQAAIRLSLFLRDESGLPLRPERDELPASFPEERPPSDDSVAADLDFARERHPRLRSLALERERLELEQRLARNELLPRLDLRVEGSQDLGSSAPGIDERGKLSDDSRSSTEVKAKLRLELPVQNRGARGRLGVARIRLAQLERREAFTRDQVVAEALLALEALRAAFDQTAQARENLELAERLRRAEERKLELGLSNLIDVNIREVQAATAARQLVKAQQAYFRALADYQARIARAS